MELFYSYGGHGGPYQTLTEAIITARRLLEGVPFAWCFIQVRKDASFDSPVLATVSKNGDGIITTETCYAVVEILSREG